MVPRDGLSLEIELELELERGLRRGAVGNPFGLGLSPRFNELREFGERT